MVRYKFCFPFLNQNTDQYPAKSFLRISPEETAFLGIEHDVISVFSNGQQLSKSELLSCPVRKSFRSTLDIASHTNFDWKNSSLLQVEESWMDCKTRYFIWLPILWVLFVKQNYPPYTVIYREGPENYHASAGVRIGSALPSHEWAALNRALLNVKKVSVLVPREQSLQVLVMAKVSISPSLDLSRPECLSGINVVVLSWSFPKISTFADQHDDDHFPRTYFPSINETFLAH